MIKFKDILLREVEIGKPGQAPDITNTGTREQFVLALSRQIINAFKRKDNRYSDEFYLSGERSGDEDRSEITLDVRFKIKPKQEYAYSISAYAHSPLVKMVIEYNPKLFPKALNALVTEVKETLEHEFEHVQQGAFYSQWIQSNKYDQPLAYPRESPQAPTHFLYLTSNVEVPAYVKGLIKKAKVNQITFNQALEDFYNDYRDTFREEGTDWQKVKKVWLDWAIANKNKLKKFT